VVRTDKGYPIHGYPETYEEWQKRGRIDENRFEKI